MAVVTTNLGPVTAYADAVAGGYKGTREEWQALMASYASVAQEAAQSAQTATDAASSATDAASSATDAASSASQSASDAEAAADSINAPDKTLTIEGRAADAKETGTRFQNFANALNDTNIALVNHETQANANFNSIETAIVGIRTDAQKMSGEVADVKRDLSDLESGLNHGYISKTDVSLWSLGVIRPSTGETASHTSRMKTGYLDNIIASVTPDSGYKMFILAYLQSNSSYVGMWTGTAFVAGLGSANWITNTINIDGFGHPEYKYRICAAKSDDDTLNIETDGTHISFGYRTDATLTIHGFPADAKKTGDRFVETNGLVNRIYNAFDNISAKDYQIYSPTFSLSPSAIENNGVLIDTLANTKTTDYINCSGWVGIRYTGSSWLVCRALAFYDENHAWIKSYPATGDTTEYVNEIIDIPVNAKYVIFANLTARQSQTLRIEVATTYKVKGKWTGKKWTCVGDSLTEHNLRSDMNYHDYVANATGITTVNMGRSGTGYKRTYDEGYAFYQRIGNVPVDSDVVTIFGSGNDLLYAENIGTPTDTFNSEDEAGNSLCACINHTIDILIGNIPTVQLGIVAPTPWKGEKPTLNNTNSMSQYVEALRQICYIRSIPFLDLYHESNLRPWTAEGRSACYSKDGSNGVHPDETGHRIIASRFEGFLDSLLLGN